ncbi:TetR/AcrR family transcriptional regulator [Streptomonospora sp. S1-112]|uniref:TetR/AcrR family transcriptional regulator n=1 Tax=Streptomonospora mangrovi TaxID=2883123 RepID=A0A9X3SIB3_9ACTN|nr:helix-turn-helix domain-containing protein [Streptomonospora mangrovi]MDA0568050.1 TetR/AcrR family transcriptional regulator [Streptomonospora mangrovi]
MGHREDLLAAAKRCLRERGYARVTARDLVAESGTNLASIGYHFGSKDELLSAALIEMVGDWADALEAGLLAEGAESADSTGSAPDGAEGGGGAKGAGEGRRAADTAAADPFARFEGVWEQVIVSYFTSLNDWRDGVEALAQARHSPAVRERMAEGYEEGRTALAPWFHAPGAPPLDPDESRALGGFYLALLTGVMVQQGIDPDRAPTARDLTLALRRIVADFGSAAPPLGTAADPAEGGGAAPDR